jgi:tetratricopeptide (TPR) repeat protein
MLMNASIDFERLMREGRLALDQGDRDLAHELWREAALLDPYNEQVWLSLLDVLESLEDRRVCLQNILEINPLNTQARRMLRAYEARQQRRSKLKHERQSQLAVLKKQRRGLMTRALMLGLLLGLSGIFFAVVLSILIYGT